MVVALGLPPCHMVVALGLPPCHHGCCLGPATMPPWPFSASVSIKMLHTNAAPMQSLACHCVTEECSQGMMAEAKELVDDGNTGHIAELSCKPADALSLQAIHPSRTHAYAWHALACIAHVHAHVLRACFRSCPGRHLNGPTDRTEAMARIRQPHRPPALLSHGCALHKLQSHIRQ